MTPKNDDFILDLSASCTKDQAVMRLLGWGHRSIYKKNIPVTENEFTQEDLKEMHPENLRLEDYLTFMYQSALDDYANAVPEDATEEVVLRVLEEKLPRIDEAEVLVETARSYMMDIVDELSKGASSALRIDQCATTATGIEHITLRSLDRWEKDFYKATNQPGKSVSNLTQGDGKEQLLECDLNELTKGNSSLFVTLALAAEAFAETKVGKYGGKNAPINVKNVSEYLQLLGERDLPKDTAFPGQSAASIKLRIDRGLTITRLLKKH